MFDFIPGGSSFGVDWSEGPGCFGHAVLVAIGLAVVIAITKWWLLKGRVYSTDTNAAQRRQ